MPHNHRKFIRTPLDKSRVWKHMKPIYERLIDEKLLKKCESHSTQNANESMHSVVWSKCPRVGFYSRSRCELGVPLGIADFNFGALYCAKLKEIFQITFSTSAADLQNKRQNKRLSNSLRRERNKLTNKRQVQRAARAKLAAELEEAEGGPVYGLGIEAVDVLKGKGGKRKMSSSSSSTKAKKSKKLPSFF